MIICMNRFSFLDRTSDHLLFGDEIEYTLIKFDTQNKKARVSLKAQYYLELLAKLKKEGNVR